MRHIVSTELGHGIDLARLMRSPEPQQSFESHPCEECELLVQRCIADPKLLGSLVGHFWECKKEWSTRLHWIVLYHYALFERYCTHKNQLDNLIRQFASFLTVPLPGNVRDYLALLLFLHTDSDKHIKVVLEQMRGRCEYSHVQEFVEAYLELGRSRKTVARALYHSALCKSNYGGQHSELALNEVKRCLDKLNKLPERNRGKLFILALNLRAHLFLVSQQYNIAEGFYSEALEHAERFLCNSQLPAMRRAKGIEAKKNSLLGLCECAIRSSSSEASVTALLVRLDNLLKEYRLVYKTASGGKEDKILAMECNILHVKGEYLQLSLAQYDKAAEVWTRQLEVVQIRCDLNQEHQVSAHLGSCLWQSSYVSTLSTSTNTQRREEAIGVYVHSLKCLCTQMAVVAKNTYTSDKYQDDRSAVFFLEKKLPMGGLILLPALCMTLLKESQDIKWMHTAFVAADTMKAMTLTTYLAFEFNKTDGVEEEWPKLRTLREDIRLLHAKAEEQSRRPDIQDFLNFAEQHNETVVQYWLYKGNTPPWIEREFELYIWVLQPNKQVTFRQQSLEHSLHSFVNNMHMAMRQGHSIENYLKRAYDLLFAPIEDCLSSSRFLSIIPDPLLLLIPFHSLWKMYCTRQSEKSRANLVAGLTVSNSLSSRIYLEQRWMKQQQEWNNPIVIGNPTEDLFLAERCAHQTAACWKVKPIIGRDATKSTIVDAMLTAEGLLHFSCHAENGNILCAGKETLSPDEIVGFDLSKIKLVVLHCCSTAHGVVLQEGVHGLARAFLVAGAASVVVSLTEVNENTSLLFSLFYPLLCKRIENRKGSIAEALLAAMTTHPRNVIRQLVGRKMGKDDDIEEVEWEDVEECEFEEVAEWNEAKEEDLHRELKEKEKEKEEKEKEQVKERKKISSLEERFVRLEQEWTTFYLLGARGNL